MLTALPPFTISYFTAHDESQTYVVKCCDSPSFFFEAVNREMGSTGQKFLMNRLSRHVRRRFSAMELSALSILPHSASLTDLMTLSTRPLNWNSTRRPPITRQRPRTSDRPAKKEKTKLRQKVKSKLSGNPSRSSSFPRFCIAPQSRQSTLPRCQLFTSFLSPSCDTLTAT